MGFLEMFRRPSIRDAASLADFIDRRAAFLVQKGIYEYSRARAGHYAKVLFAEPDFRQAVERARWSAYPLGLAMVTEVVDGILRERAGNEREAVFKSLVGLVLDRFDLYPTPGALTEAEWRAARAELARRLAMIGLHATKRAKDVAAPFAEAYFDLLPIDRTLRQSELPTVRSYLRVTLCNIHEEFSKRTDVAALITRLSVHAA